MSKVGQIKPTKYKRDGYAELQVAMFFENVRDAEIQLTKDTLQEIQRMKASGMSPEKIANSLISGDGFEKSFLNDAGQELWKAMKSISQNSVYDSMGDNLYRWECNPGAKHCEVCLKLNGQEKPFEVWQEEGTPGQRNEGCHFNCMCDLVPVEKSEKETRSYSKMDGGTISGTREESGQNNELKFNENSIKLLEKEFKDISFSRLDELPQENGEELNKGLKDFTADFGKDIFGKLTDTIGKFSVKVEYYKSNILGGYDPTTNSFHINSQFYGLNVSKEIKAKLTNSPNAFEVMVYHELMHYYFIANNITKDEAIENFYKANTNYILKSFSFIGKKNKKGEDEYPEEQKPYEFFVDATARLRAGLLKKTGSDNDNDKVYNFINEKYNSLKQVRR